MHRLKELLDLLTANYPPRYNTAHSAYVNVGALVIRVCPGPKLQGVGFSYYLTDEEMNTPPEILMRKMIAKWQD